ncbi:MAG: hypothetical protein M1840_000021 [Geoglossum simile]|nr:MAG: hypothetical protein M1840_000021 [Geoglossum simile]
MANRMVWDDAAHLRLLLTIIAQNDITPNYKAVAAAFGHGVTTNILAQRMCALRKRAFAINSESSGASASASASASSSATTPKKRVGRPPKAKGDGSSSTTTTPSKRGKKNVKKGRELSSDGEHDDMMSIDVLKAETEGTAPTTPPQTPGKLTEPCTPSRATIDSANKIKSGRVEKKHQPRISPRKRNAVTTYIDDGGFGGLLSGDYMEGATGLGPSLGDAVDDDDDEDAEDEFVPGERD